MHAHTPTHNLWFWPKRPPLAFSVAETSVAEMSGPKRHRPKCPWRKCPTFGPVIPINKRKTNHQKQGPMRGVCSFVGSDLDLNCWYFYEKVNCKRIRCQQ